LGVGGADEVIGRIGARVAAQVPADATLLTFTLWV
jgi:hypothetical protein